MLIVTLLLAPPLSFLCLFCAQYIPNRLSAISVWKCVDNLRRSLVPPAQLLWLALAWTLLPGSALHWTALVLMMFTFPAYALTSSTLLQLYHQLTAQSHPANFRLMASKTWEEVQIKVAQFALNISFLVEQSLDAVDAIARTLYRQWWSHRLMLEWTTSAQVEQLMRNGQPRPKLTQQGPLFALAVALLILLLHPSAMLVSSPFLFAWALSPWTKVYLSGRSSTSPSLTSEQRATFRTYARRTWHFFETFVTEQDHWLAPDNFQVTPHTHTHSPSAVLASPGGFVLSLTGSLAALVCVRCECRRTRTPSSRVVRRPPTWVCSCWRRYRRRTWPSSGTGSAWNCSSASSTHSTHSTDSTDTSSTVHRTHTHAHAHPCTDTRTPTAPLLLSTNALHSLPLCACRRRVRCCAQP